MKAGKEIQAGDMVRMSYGAGLCDEYGVIVKRRDTQWGPNYKVMKDDGTFTQVSTIYQPGERQCNGSGIGTWLVGDEEIEKDWAR